MEENEGQQICQNCNREIPSANFVIHTVHCTRNLKLCSVCKEPVPINELEDHHDRFHLLVPCKQCGEMARGTDMEDHIRDSCAFTMQPCRYCSLELRRREVPAHERYCGARTEQCAQCGEYVMQRYRQVHLDTNHGFVRLEEDAPPVHPLQPTNRNNFQNVLPSVFHRHPADLSLQGLYRHDTDVMIRASIMGHFSFINARGMVDREDRMRRLRAAMPRATNRRPRQGPQAQANVPAQDDAPMEPEAPRSTDRGAVRKRPAPAPPAPPTPPETAASAAPTRAPQPPPAVSTPPASPTPSVTSTCAVMSTPPASPTPSVSSTTAVKSTPPRSPSPSETEPPAPVATSAPAAASATASVATPTARPPMAEYVPPPLDSRRDMPYYSALQRRHDEERRREQETAYNLSVGSPSVLDPDAKLVKLRRTEAQGRGEDAGEGRLLSRVWYNNNLAAAHDREAAAADGGNGDATAVVDIEGALEGLTPMSPEEFTQRFNMMQLRRESRARPAPAAAAAAAPANTDRFSNIRTSLRDLRRGLGEVTAPYNNNNTATVPTSTTENNNPRADNAPTNRTTASNNPTPAPNAGEPIMSANNARRRRNGRNNLRNSSTNRRSVAQVSATVEYPFSIENGPYDIYNDDVDMNIITEDLARTRERQREALAEARAPTPLVDAHSDREAYLTCSACLTRIHVRDWNAHEENCSTYTSVGLSGRRVMLPQASRDVPMIPCEFCTELMPFFVINDHQVLCRDATLLLPD